MNFYCGTHKYYCGVDLHSTSMYVCVVGQDGAILLHRSLPCDPVRFLLAIAPFPEDLVVAAECVYASRSFVSAAVASSSSPSLPLTQARRYWPRAPSRTSPIL